MTAATCAIFFCSGAAALLFETLWFRQAGLVLGNTVWASALVTAAFMAGLALGNLFAVRLGWRLARPLRVFASLELAVALTGTGLVLTLPHISGVLAPLWARLQGTAAIDAARVLGTFVLLAVPASAMGATLPVLARSLGARDPNFGRLLGRLYDWWWGCHSTAGRHTSSGNRSLGHKCGDRSPRHRSRHRCTRHGSTWRYSRMPDRRRWPND